MIKVKKSAGSKMVSLRIVARDIPFPLLQRSSHERKNYSTQVRRGHVGPITNPYLIDNKNTARKDRANVAQPTAAAACWAVACDGAPPARKRTPAREVWPPTRDARRSSCPPAACRRG